MENSTHTQVNSETKRDLLPSLIALAGAILLVVSFFLPYLSVNEDWRDFFERNAKSTYDEESDMTYSEAIDLSLLDCDRLYIARVQRGAGKATSRLVTYITLVAVFSVLALLFAISKQPVPQIVFGALTFGAFQLVVSFYVDNELVPSAYEWGIVRWTYPIGGILVLAGAVLLLVAQKRST